MTILQGDIKLVASKIMDDVPEGGGAPTSVVIADGVSNAIFPDISELDRAAGRVNLRKVFVSIQTLNVDAYMGANVIVSDPPDDPLVSVSLFSTDNVFDLRSDARSRIESYLTVGPTFAGYLFGNHIAGMMSLSVLTRTSVLPPVVGDVLVLRKLEGTANFEEQFVRITDVAVNTREFEDANGVFLRNELTIGISDPLRVDFPGFEVKRLDTDIVYTGKTRITETRVADAARYYGTVPLQSIAGTGDFTVQGSSIFNQIVPSAQIETPIADARMNQQSSALVEAGGMLTQTISLAFTTTQSMFIGGGILPGSLTISRTGTTLADQGGKLINQATTDQVGTVDYTNGVVSLLTNVWGTSGESHSVSFRPASQPTVVSESFGIPVKVATQRLTYVVTLDPPPSRAGTTVSFRTQGRWYDLVDDGSGALRGTDTSIGVGNLNYTTGTLSTTLGSLPDIGTEIIVSWKPAATTQKFSSVSVPPVTIGDRGFFAFQLSQSIKPGSLTVNWNDGSARTATDVDGTLAGSAAIGEVLYGRGVVRISPNVLPPAGTVFTVITTEGTDQQLNVSTFLDGGSNWTFTLATGTIRANSVEIGVAASLPVRDYPGVDSTKYRLMRVFDNGAGTLQIAGLTGNITVGSINYGTGACTLSKVVTFQDVQPKFENRTTFSDSSNGQQRILMTGTENRTVNLTFLNGTAQPLDAPAWVWWTGSFGVAGKARLVGSDGPAHSENFTPTALIARRSWNRFSLGSTNYLPGPLTNQIQTAFNNGTGSGTVSGSLHQEASPLYGTSYTPFFYDGRSGFTQIDTWPAGVSSTLVDNSGVVSVPVSGAGTYAVIDSVTFRTAISPIRNGSFNIAGSFKDGTTFTATADIDGYLITGSPATSPSVDGSVGVFGFVSYDTGVVKLRFGSRTDAANAAALGVINATNLGLPGVTYIRTVGVQADTLRYNAAAFTYLPLDADLIGIDPVRLPSDGRVPIFRPGGVVVLGHTGTVGPITVSNSQTVNCGRVRLSRVRVVGANGVVINTGYTQNLDAGTVTFTDVSGYSQPVTIQHRIEDMMLLREAQINGQLTFTRAITHDYPLGSYISSALVVGDMKARVGLTYDQQSWTGVWSDDLIGSAAAASYNDVANPITITNKGGLTERWALVFTNSTSFNIIGEHVGIIGTGNTGSVCAPANPATGEPYFTIQPAGWGSGWAAGNALRFNTYGAVFPVWLVRTIRQGPETVANDSFTALIRGDIDNP